MYREQYGKYVLVGNISSSQWLWYIYYDLSSEILVLIRNNIRKLFFLERPSKMITIYVKNYAHLIGWERVRINVSAKYNKRAHAFKISSVWSFGDVFLYIINNW